jgi:hypothetical protein
MKEFYNVIKFSETSPELYKSFKDYVGHSMAESQGRSTAGFSIHTLEDKSKAINTMYFEELKKRSGYNLDSFDGSIEKFGSNLTIQGFADDINEYMIDMVLPMILNSSALSLIADFHYVGYGDTLTFNLKSNTIPKVNEIGRRQKHTFTQKIEKTTGTISLKNYAVTVITNLPAILSGRENIADLIMRAVRAIEAKIYYIVYDKFATAMSALVSPLKVTNWDEKEAIKLAQTVKAYNNGIAPVFMGTAVALKDLLPASTGLRIDIKDEYNTTIGYMTNFNTYRVMVMEQIPDYDNVATYGLKLDDKKIYVVSPNAGKLIQVGIGDSLANTDDAFDNANLSILGTTRKGIGAECITNAIAGIITLA